MTEFFNIAETLSPDEREYLLFETFGLRLRDAMQAAPGLGRWLAQTDPLTITNRAALQTLPVLRKPEMMEMQAAYPPFGGFVAPQALLGNRIFQSPGPIWEPQALGLDPAQAARALHAAGFRKGMLALNAFSYHMTPGGFMFDEGLRAMGCTVFAAGTGNTDLQVEAAYALKPHSYCGTPDFLKAILDKAAQLGRDLSSITHAMVSGGALFPSLREDYQSRGIATFQSYATAEFGIIAYETLTDEGELCPGMVLNENLIVEIVRPGSNEPLPDGEVGELVVTRLNPAYPLVRFGTGDLTAIIAEPSPCGRTNKRIRGWLGRADQRTKVKGMFVDPRQIGDLLRRHSMISRARLVVSRDGQRDAMTLYYEAAADLPAELVATSLRDATQLGGMAEQVPLGTLPNDGKIIADERNYS